MTAKINRFESLDGLRGICALAVVLWHLEIYKFAIYFPNSFLSTNAKNFLLAISSGPVAVQIFFILTGFLMASVYPKVENYFGFVGKRLSRLLPAYYSIVIYYFLNKAVPTINNQLLGASVNIFLLFLVAIIVSYLWTKIVRKINKQTGNSLVKLFVLTLTAIIIGSVFIPLTNLPRIFFDLSFTTKIVNPSLVFIPSTVWSLFPEIFFYLAYPSLIVPIINVFSGLSKSKIFMIFLLILILLYSIQNSFNLLQITLTLQPIRWTGFFFGILISTIITNGKVNNKILKIPPVIKIIFGIIFFSMLIENETFGQSLMSFNNQLIFRDIHYLLINFLCFLLVLGIIRSSGKFVNILKNRIFKWLGKISYSLYLVHVPIIALFPSTSQTNILENIMFKIFLLLISLGVAQVIYSISEKPYFDFKNEKR